MRFPWPRKREPDRVERVAEQAKVSKATIDRVDRVIDKAIEVLPDGAMREIRRTEHAAGHGRG